MTALPAWAEWNEHGAGSPWTVGIEEEVMLLDPDGWALASRIDDVLPVLSRDVADHAAAETHGSALELFSGPHPTARGAAEELARLRAGLAADLAPLGLRAAVAGTHPFAQWSDVEVSPGARYQSIYDSMRELARREPTFALHVHVAVPDPEAAIRALRGLRVHVPLLLALAANSPFWQGRDTGLASARVPVFGTFPRVGIPRPFNAYPEYVEAIDVLLRCGAFPEPTFLWWDVRLQPKLGTIEVRIMDAQTRAADNAALAALVQSIVRLEALEGFADEEIACRPEVLDENRFLATRDGMQAEFLDPERAGRRPAAEILEELLAALGPHAAALGSESELAAVPALAAEPGYHRQRLLAGVAQGDDDRARARRPGLRAGDRLQRRAGGAGRGLAGPADRGAGLELVRVVRVALAEVGGPHPQAVVLVLPDVRQLVGDEVVGDLGERFAQQDQVAHVVAVEALEPRQGEEPARVEDPDLAGVERPRVEREPRQPRARPGRSPRAPPARGRAGPGARTPRSPRQRGEPPPRLLVERAEQRRDVGGQRLAGEGALVGRAGGVARDREPRGGEERARADGSRARAPAAAA